MNSLSELNSADHEGAVTLVIPLIERAPEIAKKMVNHRPFKNKDDLHQALKIELLALSEKELLDLFNSHPELAPENPLSMTSASQSEQKRLDLTSKNNKYRDQLAQLNKRYRCKFDFPFITALVHHKDINSVLAEFEARLLQAKEVEIRETIEQILSVSASRIQAAFNDEHQNSLTTTAATP